MTIGKKKMHPSDDLEYLKSWVCKIESMLGRMKDLSAKSGGRMYFTIGNTTKPTDKLRPYTTPIRKVATGVVCGVVVFTQTQGVLAALVADKYVDSIIVDAEKKLPIEAGLGTSPFEYLGYPVPRVVTEGNGGDSELSTNLSLSCSEVITKAKFFEYKSNDMTVEGLWYYLAHNLNGLTGKRVAVVGAGNIGFKITIKLVESGTNVYLVRRDQVKGTALAEAANLIKPPATIANVEYCPDALNSSHLCDAVLGCTNGVAAINSEIVSRLRKGTILIDVGKGSITSDAVKLAADNGVNVMRFDVTSAIDGMIATIERNQEVSMKVGRRVVEEGLAVVSGGYLGTEGDLVVDDYRAPEQVFGVCDGEGDFKQKLSPKDVQNLNRVSELFHIAKDVC